MTLRVHEVMELNHLLDREWVPDFALERGSAVHKATALDDLGRLLETSVHPVVRPYLESWRKYRGRFVLEVKHVELAVRHDPLDYRGTLDALVVFRGRHDVTLIDKKAGAPLPWHCAQTAGYALAFAFMFKTTPPERGAVYLQADGSPAVFVPHKDRGDFDAWKNFVGTANWKLRNRITHGLTIESLCSNPV